MPSSWAACWAVNWPALTCSMRLARSCEGVIYSVFVGFSWGLASWICSNRSASLRVLTVFCRFNRSACNRGLKASPRARLTLDSSAWSIPSIARSCHCLKVIQGTFICRQTSTGLHRSVHTARMAWAFSWAENVVEGVRGFLGFGLFEVVDEFLILVSIVDRKFEFSFFGPEDDRLTFHAADHVEGRLGLP